MSRRVRRAAAWLLVAACLVPWRGAGPGDSGPLPRRLLGPIPSIAASVEWVRFDAALREGRYERAYAHAERALRLDPAAPQGWITFASHLTYFRGSAETEPDPAARRAWIEAGTALLERGEAVASDPGELAFARGLMYAHVATVDGPQGLVWPGGRRAAADLAAAAFHRAGELGHPRGFAVERIVRDPDFGAERDDSR